jgi:hypothetical protein
MAGRHDNSTKPQPQEIRQADRWVQIAAVLALVALVLINAKYPKSVPDIAFWILGAAIVGKEAVQYLLPGVKK